MVTMRSSSGIACDRAFSSVVLPALVAPATRRFQPAATAHRRKVAATPSAPKSASATGRAPNRRMVTHGPSTANGGIDRVQPGAVGEPGVDHRRRPVETESEGSDDPLDEVDDRGRIELERHRLEPPGTFDVGMARTVDHHLGDRRVGQQRLERTEPGDLVGELFQQRVDARGREQRLLVVEQVDESAAQRVAVVPAIVDALVDQTPVHPLLQPPVFGRFGRRQRDDGHAASPRRPGATPIMRTSSWATRASGSGMRLVSTPASTARAMTAFTGTRDEHRELEHVADLLRRERPPGFVEQDHACAPVQHRGAHRSPEREVATPHDHQRDVGHLDHRLQRGLASGAAVDEHRRRARTERNRERGTALG